EVALRAHRQADLVVGAEAALRATGVGVHLELGAQAHSVLVEATGEESPVVAVLQVAGPGHHEAAQPVGAHADASQVLLVVGRVGVDLELGPAAGSGAVVPLAEDTGGGPGLAGIGLPHHAQGAAQLP